MRSILTVSTPAADTTLLSAAELRAAIGLAADDMSKDVELTATGARVAASIAKTCKVKPGGVSPPTLRSELLTEVFHFAEVVETLKLSRYPVSSLTSVVEGTSFALTADQYEIGASSGLLYRMCNGHSRRWHCARATVVYQAGWETVPDDLKFAAVKYVQAIYQQGSRDPLLRSVTVDGVGSRDFWVDPTKDTVVPPEVTDLLEAGGYIDYRFG